MFYLRYIGLTVYHLSTHTSVAVQKRITFIDVSSAMFCSNVMDHNCNFEFVIICGYIIYWLTYDMYAFISLK